MPTDPPTARIEAPAWRPGTPVAVGRRVEAIVAAPEQMETVVAALRALAPVVEAHPAQPCSPRRPRMTA